MQDYGLGLQVCPHCARASTSNFNRIENLFVLSQYISDRGDRCIACQVKGCAFPKTMSAKATATAAWDWKDPEDADQAPGPHPISAPIQVPPSPPHDPHVLPPKGFKKPWKGKIGKGG